jgi:hypothetical protein
MVPRRLGWALVAIGLVVVAAGVPGATWLNRHNQEAFNNIVGWANVLAMSVGAIGVVLLVIDRLHTDAGPSSAMLQEMAYRLNNQVLRQEGRQLARLLGTDELDFRVARVTLEHHSPGGSRGRGRRSSARPIVIESVTEYYLNQTCGRLAITGAPGAGKTVIALRILTDLATRRRHSGNAEIRGTVLPVPVLFNVGLWPPSTRT